MNSFQNNYDPNNYNFSLNGSEFRISEFERNTVLKIEKEIAFASINMLILFINNSAPLNTVYNIKGIFINRKIRDHSYFIFSEFAFPLKLIGKTYRNKKMYVDLASELISK